MTTTKSLCEICLPKQWKTISTDMLMDEGFPVYGANGVIGCYSEYNHEHPTLLVTCRGATCGTLNICQPYSYVNGNAMALDNLIDEVDINFLYYYLLNRGFEDVITGSAQPQIVRQSLQKVSVTYPSKEKQREIVITLEKVSELIALRKEQLAKLDELVKSRFIELFGDEQEFFAKARNQVSDVCESKVGIVIQPTQYYTEDTNNSIKAFRSLNVKPFRVNDADWVYFTVENNNLMQRTQVHTNDVAVVRSGVNLGDSCVIPVEFDGCNAIDILILTSKSCILPIYLSAFINYPCGKNQIINVQRGGALKHLNNKQLQDAQIYLPPIELQAQFASFVEQTDKSKLAIQQSLDKLETLKKSLMQKYFG